jgi:hypothetical protein
MVVAALAGVAQHAVASIVVAHAVATALVRAQLLLTAVAGVTVFAKADTFAALAIPTALERASLLPAKLAVEARLADAVALEAAPCALVRVALVLALGLLAPITLPPPLTVGAHPIDTLATLVAVEGAALESAALTHETKAAETFAIVRTVALARAHLVALATHRALLLAAVVTAERRLTHTLLVHALAKAGALHALFVLGTLPHAAILASETSVAGAVAALAHAVVAAGVRARDDAA